MSDKQINTLGTRYSYDTKRLELVDTSEQIWRSLEWNRYDLYIHFGWFLVAKGRLPVDTIEIKYSQSIARWVVLSGHPYDQTNAHAFRGPAKRSGHPLAAAPSRIFHAPLSPKIGVRFPWCRVYPPPPISPRRESPD